VAHDVRIAISCPDRTGLLSAITGCLFDMEADIGDASFAVLGSAAEFTTVATLPDTLAANEVSDALQALAELAGADVSVTPFALGAIRSESGQVTHRSLCRLRCQYRAHGLRTGTRRCRCGLCDPDRSLDPCCSRRDLHGRRRQHRAIPRPFQPRRTRLNRPDSGVNRCELRQHSGDV
jgi:predicted amino acid-binding ACT domain protein